MKIQIFIFQGSRITKLGREETRSETGCDQIMLSGLQRFSGLGSC